MAPHETGTTDPVPVEPSPLKRRLTAVLLADIVGYSRLMSLDEEGTHGRIAGYMNELIDPTLAEYGGMLVRNMGDAMLVVFASALDAVRCGLDIQRRLADRQVDIPDGQIQFRIGINTGDVIFDDRDIYGHSVNITARLESIAHPGSVCVSQSIYDQTRSQPGLRFSDKGLHRVKNIDYPIRVFEVSYGQAPRTDRRRLTRRYVGLAASAIVGLAILGVFMMRDRESNLPQNSIMVLPFRNLSSSTDDRYFADAITDDLTTDLSRLPHAFVIASATAMTYKERVADARTIGRECGARYLLEGSVRRVDRTVQINVQLIDTYTGAGVWADRFTYKTENLSDLEEAVTSRIGNSLNIQLVKAKKRFQAGNLAADHNPLDERLRAMALMVGAPTPEKTLEARRDVEECLRQDPNSAECWTRLARLLVGDYLNAWNNTGLQDVDRAEQAYQRALAIDPSIAGAHHAAGYVRRVRGDHHGALAEFEKAIELDPNLAVAYAQKANELVFLGRGKEAVPVGEKAVRLSPGDPAIGVFYWVIGRAYFTEGNYDQAAVWLAQSVEKRPNLWYNRAWLISARSLIHRNIEARVALDDFQRTFPTYTLARIKQIYSKEAQYENPTMQAATEHLLQGLADAGLQ